MVEVTPSEVPWDGPCCGRKPAGFLHIMHDSMAVLPTIYAFVLPLEVRAEDFENRLIRESWACSSLPDGDATVCARCLDHDRFAQR